MKKLLFTGGTGFLGRHVMPVLKEKYEVTTIGITDADELKANFVTDTPKLPCRYDVVLHAAGKAHVVPRTEAEKQAFYDVNLHGTIHLCNALDEAGVPKSFIFISTLSVYGSEAGKNDTEDSRELVGDSPYADSKIKAEQYLTEWCKKRGVVLTIFRPALLAGVGAPGNLGAMVKGIKSGFYASVAGGKAHKSILMAEDIGRLIPLAEDKGGVYNLCDNHNPTFREIEKVIAKQLGKRPPIVIPYWIAKCMAVIGDVCSQFPINTARLEKIITDDTFSSAKAQKDLGWEPLNVIENYKIS